MLCLEQVAAEAGVVLWLAFKLPLLVSYKGKFGFPD